MIATDKLLHLLAGMVITYTIGILFGPFLGILSGIFAGAAKEYLWDYQWNLGTPEWMDFWYTAVGSMIAFVVMIF